MTDPMVTFERAGSVAVLSLCRPERRNALTDALLAQLEAVCRDLGGDEQTRAVILQGAGGDFSVGADLKQVRPRESLLMRRRSVELGARVIAALQGIPQPTICALHGVATGGGACLAAACDFRIAAHGARVGFGEVRMGMNLMWRALPLCVRLVGAARTKRMLMSGELFDAETLLAWGFHDELVAPQDLQDRARAWAETYARLPPMAVQMIKRSVNAFAGALDQAVMHQDSDQWLLASRSDDFREAVSAFLERRAPTFTGD